MHSTLQPRGADRLAATLGIVAATAYAVLLTWAIGSTTYDVWGGLLLAPVLLAISLPVLARIARTDAHVGFGLLATALTCKLLSSLARYWQQYVLYDSPGDAQRYHEAGVRIAQALHEGREWFAAGPFPGTAYIEGFTGYLYWIIGPTLVGGFIIYSWLGFWGLLLFQRALSLAVPDGAVRRYALLVLFLPSLQFWPSSIGKDAWMTLCLGLGAYGAARLFTHRRGGVLCLALSLGGVSLVRPHMAVLLIGGVFVGYLLRPSNPRARLGPILKGAGVLVLVIAGSLLVTQAEKFFGVDGSNDSSVQSVQEFTVDRTQQGGSAIEAEPVRSPLQLPGATVSVLLRPFPWEADSLQSLAASAETLLLVALAWRGRRSLLALPRRLRSHPYTGFVLTYVLLFVVAFSSVANLGILSRQRVQVFPFVLVLLCLPEVPRPPARHLGARRRTAPAAHPALLPALEPERMSR